MTAKGIRRPRCHTGAHLLSRIFESHGGVGSGFGFGHLSRQQGRRLPSTTASTQSGTARCARRARDGDGDGDGEKEATECSKKDLLVLPVFLSSEGDLQLSTTRADQRKKPPARPDEQMTGGERPQLFPRWRTSGLKTGEEREEEGGSGRRRSPVAG